MDKEIYGLSKKDYREMIESPQTTAADIAKKIIVPDRVFRFRKLGREDESGKWVESHYWLEDVTGICKFSIPSSFCSINDNDDCKVRFDNDKVLAYMLARVSPKYTKKRSLRCIKAILGSKLEEYKVSLQKTMRVGCFTTASPLNKNMWEDLDFGDKGRGICIEYEVNNENFRPDNLPFLPVLYCNDCYDNTEAMKAVVDFAHDNTNQVAAAKMVCLGYGHTIIKPLKYAKEQEWRLVIPIREDKTHLDYFTIDNESKRNMTPAIRAIYMGYRITELENFEVYKNKILTKWLKENVPVYQVNAELQYKRVYA